MSTARSFVHVLPKSISSAALTAPSYACGCSTTLRMPGRAGQFTSARHRRRCIARGEIRGQRRERGFDARAGRKRAIESHVEKAPLDVVPRLLADDEVAADVEQDVVEARFDAEIAETRGNRARPARTATRRGSHRRPFRSAAG